MWQWASLICLELGSSSTGWVNWSTSFPKLLQRLREVIGMKELCGLLNAYTCERLVIFFFFTVITITFPSFVSCPYSCSVGSLTCVSGGEGLRFPLTPRKLERRCHLLYVLLGTSFLTRQVGDKDSKHSRQSKGSSDKKSEITRHSAWHKGDS